jgi:hypothetical protein
VRGNYYNHLWTRRRWGCREEDINVDRSTVSSGRLSWEREHVKCRRRPRRIERSHNRPCSMTRAAGKGVSGTLIIIYVVARTHSTLLEQVGIYIYTKCATFEGGFWK